MILLAGKYKGRKLRAPKGQETRPTTSLVRKALFDICQGYIEDAHFLDLFAGTGAMGLEALSRGASHATFIEKDRDALHCIEHNIKLLECSDQTTVLRGNSLLIMKKLKQSYDIIYIDPPYETLALKDLLTVIDHSQLLNPEGHLFIETLSPAQEKLEEISFQHLQFKDVRRLGKTLLYHFFFLS